MRRTKTALASTGDYDADKVGGVDGIPDKCLFTAIEGFQTREGLKIDGLMRPGGETEQRLKDRARLDPGAGRTADPPSRPTPGDDQVEADREARLRKLAAKNRAQLAQRRAAVNKTPPAAKPRAANPPQAAPSSSTSSGGPDTRAYWEKRGWGGPRGEFGLARADTFEKRREHVSSDKPTYFDVSDNAEADGSEPWHSLSPFEEVSSNSKVIDDISAKFGVDPELVKSVVYLESSQGWYDRVADWVPGVKNETIRPMNVHAEVWKDLGYSREVLSDPKANIEAGVTLLSRLISRTKGADIRKVGTLYNNLSATRISD